MAVRYRHPWTAGVKGSGLLASFIALRYSTRMNRCDALRTQVRFASMLACLVLAGVGSLPGLALAQADALGGSGLGAGTNRRTPSVLPTKTPAPPALPGAQSGGPGAQSGRVALDMPPTEALFEGVNRGDIETVRDALSRGAELNAQNILGITATELAIDLGRNDIAFLLLSMRGAQKPRGSRSQTMETAAPKPAPRPAPAPRVAATRTERTEQRVYANDPGTPAPSAGFLGFDERHSGR